MWACVRGVRGVCVMCALLLSVQGPLMATTS